MRKIFLLLVFLLIFGCTAQTNLEDFDPIWNNREGIPDDLPSYQKYNPDSYTSSNNESFVNASLFVFSNLSYMISASVAIIEMKSEEAANEEFANVRDSMVGNIVFESYNATGFCFLGRSPLDTEQSKSAVILCRKDRFYYYVMVGGQGKKSEDVDSYLKRIHSAVESKFR